MLATPSLANTNNTPSSPKRSPSPVSRRRSHSHSHYHTPKKRSGTSQSQTGKPSILQVGRVIGTTASSHANFSVVGNTLAYTAGAGAVVRKLSSESGLGNDQQRFFCTSTKVVQSIQQSVATASSVPTWLAEYTNNNFPSPVRDSNGYLVGGLSQNDVIQSTSLGINNEDLSNLASGAKSAVKDKMKTASCVALSADQSLVAVGEIGHQPRVFIYSTAPDSSSSTPLAILCEHRYGIKAVSFSPCGKFLATLGNTSDGFLHIWQLSTLREGSVHLHSSNRCISVIHDMKWLNSSTLVTTGVRQIRIWRLDRPGSSSSSSSATTTPQWVDTKANVLAGRNLVLNEHANSVFVSVVPFVSRELHSNSSGSDCSAIVASEKGDIAIIHADSSDGRPIFTPKLSTGREICSIALKGEDTLLVAGASGITSYPIQGILQGEYSGSATGYGSNVPSNRPQQYKAIGVSSESQVAVLTASRDILLDGQVLEGSHAQELNGIRTVGKDKVLTWSIDGVIRVWNSKGYCEKVYQTNSIDLSIAYLDENVLITGDKNGCVFIEELEESSSPSSSSSSPPRATPSPEPGKKYSFVAHGSSVVGIDYCRKNNTFVTCSRDRTLQVFKKQTQTQGGDGGAWELHQTLPAHKGTIHAVYFTPDGDRIVSCSADRTVAIHRLVSIEEAGGSFAFVSEKTISLKTAPLDMCLDQQDRIIISTDKHIMIYKVSGEYMSSYRCMDHDTVGGIDSINLNVISMGSVNGNPYLAGVAPDKGIRVYDHSTGVYIGTDWGHSEGISGITWVEDEKGTCKIASSGYDGCIFLWNILELHSDPYTLSLTPSTPVGSTTGPSGTGAAASGAAAWSQAASPSPTRVSPTRKILSRQELSRFLPKIPSGGSSSPSPSASPRGSRVLPRAGAGNNGGNKRSLTPSKSMVELKPKNKSLAPSAASPAPPVTPVVPASSEARRSAGTEVDQLIASLSRFRDVYKRANRSQDQAKVDKLKQELRLTSALLEGRVNDRARVDDLVEMFGDRLVTLVESKLKLGGVGVEQDENTPPQAE